MGIAWPGCRPVFSWRHPRKRRRKQDDLRGRGFKDTMEMLTPDKWLRTAHTHFYNPISVLTRPV